MKPWMLAAALFGLALVAGLAIELWIPRAQPQVNIDTNQPLGDEECNAFLNKVMNLQFDAADQAAKRAGKSAEAIREHRQQVLNAIQADPARLDMVKDCKAHTSRDLFACVMRCKRLADMAGCDPGLLGAPPDAGR